MPDFHEDKSVLMDRLLSAAGTLPEAPLAMPEQDMTGPTIAFTNALFRLFAPLAQKAGH